MAITFINDLDNNPADGTFNIAEIGLNGTLDFTFDVSAIAGVADGDFVVINGQSFEIPAGTVGGTGTGMFVINFNLTGVNDGPLALNWTVTDTSDSGNQLADGMQSTNIDQTAPASAQGAIEMPTYKYKSALNGGDGVLRYVDERSILIDEYVIPPAATLYLKHSDVHTVSCSKGAIWVVEELGFRANETTVLGSPFCVDDLYRKPKQFEINNAYQKLRRTAQALIDDHALAA
ncbi:hypothetical protein N9M10_04485 [Hellea sp.]|nr:hypothetical protein [Hellea sp.]